MPEQYAIQGKQNTPESKPQDYHEPESKTLATANQTQGSNWDGGVYRRDIRGPEVLHLTRHVSVCADDLSPDQKTGIASGPYHPKALWERARRPQVVGFAPAFQEGTLVEDWLGKTEESDQRHDDAVAPLVNFEGYSREAAASIRVWDHIVKTEKLT